MKLQFLITLHQLKNNSIQLCYQIESDFWFFADGLILHHFLPEVGVEPEEVDQLGGGIDFSLKYTTKSTLLITNILYDCRLQILIT